MPPDDSGTLKLSARLLDYNGNPVPNKTVKIYIYDWKTESNTLLVSGVTDNDGYVYATYSTTQTEIEFHVVFEGDSGYAPSEAYVGWYPQLNPTRIDFVAVPMLSTQGEYRVKLVARFTDYNGNPLSYEIVQFNTYDPSTDEYPLIGIIATDKDGYVSTRITDVYTTRMLEAYFPGDNSYYVSDSVIWWVPASMNIPSPSATPTQSIIDYAAVDAYDISNSVVAGEKGMVYVRGNILRPSGNYDFYVGARYVDGPAPSIVSDICGTLNKGDICYVKAPSRNGGTVWEYRDNFTYPIAGSYIIFPEAGYIDGGDFVATENRGVVIVNVSGSAPTPTPTPTPTPSPSPTPSPTPTPTQECVPLFRTGIGFLDAVLFCVNGVGITMLILVAIGLLSWWLYKGRLGI
ncbi:MAG: Ig-like domain-containing protein [Thermofilum sp.]|uniref:Ig-like domain-containing protein n=1 Tax=Thermofilum sp. TaxID=1961369 RepID=UPI002587E3ED|nr:Ig-like domain-containing protein [Thermofilum sp.]MCI4407834.1 Ig-like domain-containing protein [Thermofilum sp.]